MCSLFRIVYLIETSLSVQSLVPAPPQPPWLIVPTQRGKWPAASLFKTVQLSKWQWHFHKASLGSSTLFTHTHPTPCHCKPPEPRCPCSPSSRQGTAPELMYKLTIRWAARLQISTLFFLFCLHNANSNMPLMLCLIEKMMSVLHPDVIIQKLFFF